MLCTNAKGILQETLQSPELQNTPIELKTVDIMKKENAQWFDVYCYDVPVLHVDRPGQAKPVKFMHYFDKKKLTEEFLKGEKRI
ncbi:Glutaredoxin-like protein [Meyerozyma sp. JA9]|nr:Glutaredoxin-like protein [Meyerozyma sp. JA9]